MMVAGAGDRIGGFDVEEPNIGGKFETPAPGHQADEMPSYINN